MRSIFAICMICVHGCGTAVYQVPRTAHGQPAHQDFISAHQYEWFLEGEANRERGNCEEALTAFRRALAGPSSDPFFVVRLAQSEFECGDRTRALALLQETQDAHPHPEIAVALGELLFATGAAREACDVIRAQSMTALSPASYVDFVGLTLNLQQAIACERMTAGSESTRERLLRSLLSYQAQDVPASLLADETILLTPNMTELAALVAQHLLRRGNWAEAHRIARSFPHLPSALRLQIAIARSDRSATCELLLNGGAERLPPESVSLALPVCGDPAVCALWEETRSSAPQRSLDRRALSNELHLVGLSGLSELVNQGQ